MIIRPPPDMKIRLSADLRQRVMEASKQNNRTMNAEIVSRLEQTFREDENRTGALDATQNSPTIKLEKRLLSVEAALETRIEKLEREVAELKRATGKRK